MEMIYSDKQRTLMNMWRADKLKRLNMLEGSVRSGTTGISLVLWAFWISCMPREKNYLMVAKTLTSLRRNCLDLLQELVGVKYFTYSLPKKEARLFGRLVYLEGVNDARAESKIRGMTLQGAYCDELTLFTEDFFSMLLSRLSEKKAKLFGTTNPDSPNHWLKKNYIDRKDKLDMLVERFLIDDNPYLDKEYVENLKKEYSGVFYDRFIKGLWVLAEGLIYPMFNEKEHVVREVPEAGRYFISIDYGTLNPCSMGLWCLNGKQAIRIVEYYHSGRDTQRQLTDEEYYQALEKLAGERYIEYVVVDPSAASFITCIQKHRKFRVRKAKNEVVNGIRVTTTMLQNKNILFHESCRNTIKEFGLYRWDDKAAEDRVIKENDHAMDDIRYFCNTILKDQINPRQNYSR